MYWRRIVALFLVICLLGFTSCIEIQQSVSEFAQVASDLTANTSDNLSENNQQLTVHYFDVGQGDSIFLELPDGTCMLIDAAEAEYGARITEEICLLGYEHIDYVIATHPHADHIGGMKTVLNTFSIGCLYLPDVSASTSTYIGMAETILELNVRTEVAKAGVVIFDTGELSAKFLSPTTIDETDQNRNSAVLLLCFGNTRFLFMGDADTSIENTLGTQVKCDVLKVGHHGSRTASGEQFLKYAAPAYAIISCGEGNSYGHPHQETLQRLEDCGATILRTDLSGTITVCSDGELVKILERESQEPDFGISETFSEISSENPASVGNWILNTSSKKIHRPNCEYAAKIAAQNLEKSEKTVAELMQEGYTPCGFCKPQD